MNDMLPPVATSNKMKTVVNPICGKWDGTTGTEREEVMEHNNNEWTTGVITSTGTMQHTLHSLFKCNDF